MEFHRGKNRQRLLISIVCATLVVVAWQGCSLHGFQILNSTTDLSSTAGTPATGNTIEACAPASDLAAAPIQRLTKIEYNNVIRDLFGLTKDYSAGFSADAEGSAGFTTEGVAQNLSLSVVTDYWNASQAVVTDLFALNPNPLLATCSSGTACAKTIITNLATKAFRQPPTDAEVTSLLAVYTSAGSTVFTDGLKLAVNAILVSPNFIFRVYQLPADNGSTTTLTDYELASRLSFFIWGSIPDAALLADAAQGRLRQTAVLEGHVRRMLADSRVSYLAKSFGYEWLKLDKFETTSLDTTRFPTWNDSLKQSMKNETLTFANNVFTQDQSVMDFITAKYSFLDKNMSQHYGIAGATGTQFTKLPLDTHRIGVLTQASILALTSVSSRTAPVRRGKWFLEQILCSGVGQPPANVPPLPVPANGDLTDESMIRERLAQHVQQGAACMGCHSALDPVGFAYENYDAAGIFRTTYLNGKAVDASGKLPSGEAVSNFIDLATIAKNDVRYPLCFSKKIASFAQGRDMTTYADTCTTQNIAMAIGPNQKFSDLVVRIVLDNSFRSRKVNY